MVEYEFFTTEELRCPCPRCVASTIIPCQSIMIPLKLIRVDFARPIRVTCGIRCEAHNKDVGGADDSRHLPIHADGVDIACADSGMRYELVKLAMKWHVPVIEVCPGHLHLDARQGSNILFLGADH